MLEETRARRSPRRSSKRQASSISASCVPSFRSPACAAAKICRRRRGLGGVSASYSRLGSGLFSPTPPTGGVQATCPQVPTTRHPCLRRPTCPRQPSFEAGHQACIRPVIRHDHRGERVACRVPAAFQHTAFASWTIPFLPSSPPSRSTNGSSLTTDSTVFAAHARDLTVGADSGRWGSLAGKGISLAASGYASLRPASTPPQQSISGIQYEASTKVHLFARRSLAQLLDGAGALRPWASHLRRQRRTPGRDRPDTDLRSRLRHQPTSNLVIHNVHLRVAPTLRGSRSGELALLDHTCFSHCAISLGASPICRSADRRSGRMPRGSASKAYSHWRSCRRRW
jgi:hypothetical protein